MKNEIIKLSRYSYARLYRMNSQDKTVCIFLHGATDGIENPFLTYEIAGLVKNNYNTCALQFSYIKAKKNPSKNYQNELQELKLLTLRLHRIGYINFILIGKSLGGVIALSAATHEMNTNIIGLCILGIPMKLGIPADLSLLKSNKQLPPYLQQYKTVFSQLRIPCCIIQGSTDNLTDLQELEDSLLMNQYTKLFTVDNADHGFQSSQSLTKNYWQQVLNLCASWINTTFSHDR